MSPESLKPACRSIFCVPSVSFLNSLATFFLYTALVKGDDDSVDHAVDKRAHEGRWRTHFGQNRRADKKILS
jgi:hypothetical protein